MLFSVPPSLHLLWDLEIADPSSSQKVEAAAMQLDTRMFGNTHTHFTGKDIIFVAQCLFFPEGQSFKVSLILLYRFRALVP